MCSSFKLHVNGKVHEYSPGSKILVLNTPYEPNAEQGYLATWGIYGGERYNARGESIMDLDLWVGPFITGRVLIPVSSFREYTCDFRSDDNRVLMVAGILKDNEVAMITTDANEMVARVHHRMPAIIPWDLQLDYLLGTPEDAQKMLVPYPGFLHAS